MSENCFDTRSLARAERVRGRRPSPGGSSAAVERGFTLAELIVVLVIVAALSAVAVPRLNGAVSLRDDAWRDQVVSALRQARRTAVASRRLVCASVATGNVALSIAGANPALACSAAVPGFDGGAAARAANAPTTSASPAATIYFQPSGRISSDAAGTLVTDFSVAIAGVASVTVIGETGHVE
jgi:prepilin-type N-terminal cleavage/methylation domain-containing protein